MEMNQSFDFLKKYGDRTSSAISLYSHFQSELGSIGDIRFIEKKNLVAIANEPLAPYHQRKNLIFNFFAKSKYKTWDKLIFPISKSLAEDLEQVGFNTWQIGSEPIFNLKEYFKNNEDYLDGFPIAKSLKKRGAKVRELNELEIRNLSDSLNEIKEHWLSQKKMSGFEFLNVVDIDELNELKRYFILEDRKKIVAYLTAVPIFLNNQIIGYFFNDIIKGGNSRSATNELLILESMKLLNHEGIIEVRLGMSPLARLDEKARDYKKLNMIFSKAKLGYNFNGLYQFKSKLRPTSWRPVFLASNQKNINLVFINILRLHLTSSTLKEFTIRSWYGLKQNLKTNTKTQALKLKDKSKGLMAHLSRVKFTFSLSFLFISLHYLRLNSNYIKNLFENSAFQAQSNTMSGLFLGPLFHNHLYHLFGDQLSFVIFGSIIEYWFGAKIFLSITALGLWLSNPLTEIFLATNLKYLSPANYKQMLIEKDYGSSNAVFALIGSTIFSLDKKAWLFIPMFFHALFICFQRESFLSIHHFIGMYIGYAFMSWWVMLAAEKKN